MLLQRLNKMRNDERGFTLIELLVVILIIGILAAIALPTFLGQREKAQDSSAKSDARNAITQIESCLVDATFAACTAGTTPLVELPDGVNATAGATEGLYNVTATSDSTGTFTITKSDPGTYSRTCGPAARQGEGGCPESGTW